MSSSSPHQSAYRPGHSNETTLLKIVYDLLTALEYNHISLLSLLDLSTAFDTTDHETLLSGLHRTFGISDTALSWFLSYLLQRTQVVSVNGRSPSPSLSKFGVPQGSVLNPILFVLNTQATITPCLIIVSLMTTSSTNQDKCRIYRTSFNQRSVVFLTSRTG